MPSAVATAGGLALAASQGSHPATRLDAFLRSTEPVYQNAEAPQEGDRFIRQMSTYGLVRPSAAFITESRAHRPFNKDSAIDMSNLPAPWHDPTGGPREGTLVVPQPRGDASKEFVELYKNDKLMLPSERREEAKRIVQGEKQWRADRQANFAYNKTMKALELKYPNGVLGVDGPMFPETRIWAERRERLQEIRRHRQSHAEGRFAHLAEQSAADDASTLRRWGSEPTLHRSQDIPIQRKSVDPNVHPARFYDTYSRLFPTYKPVWDPERAASLRSHDVRQKRYDIINGTDNSVSFEVAHGWGKPTPAEAAASDPAEATAHGGG